jgi:tRNA (guanine-N7-)-methyltransferase
LRGLATPRHRHDFFSVLELTSDVDRLDLERIFGRAAPLHVDLGCGDGSFLCELALRYPDKDFLGIERLLGRVRSATRKAALLNNVRILRAETSYAVRYLLPKQSVEVFHLLFPDPWPKRRHQQRRLVTADLLHAIRVVLVDDGILRIATDQADYFERMRRIVEKSKDFAVAKLNGGDDLPVSTFEKRFKSEGAPIYRLELRKISPVM